MEWVFRRGFGESSDLFEAAPRNPEECRDKVGFRFGEEGEPGLQSDDEEDDGPDPERGNEVERRAEFEEWLFSATDFAREAVESDLRSN
jgi:hypothetical protein